MQTTCTYLLSRVDSNILFDWPCFLLQNVETRQTLSGVGLVLLGVLLFTGIQALLMRTTWFGRPRQVRPLPDVGYHTLYVCLCISCLLVTNVFGRHVQNSLPHHCAWPEAVIVLQAWLQYVSDRLSLLLLLGVV